MDTIKVFKPASDRAIDNAELLEVFPTPPFPPTNTNWVGTVADLFNNDDNELLEGDVVATGLLLAVLLPLLLLIRNEWIPFLAAADAVALWQ